MDLGAFSVSLTVKDLKLSKEFYQKLGFTDFGADVAQDWAIMKNGDCVIGLFQGMFEKNMLTFNPGWDNDAQEVDPYKDIRDLQAELKSNGVSFIQEVEMGTEGPGSFLIEDPDGNPILFDQHR